MRVEEEWKAIALVLEASVDLELEVEVRRRRRSTISGFAAVRRAEKGALSYSLSLAGPVVSSAMSRSWYSVVSLSSSASSSPSSSAVSYTHLTLPTKRIV